MAGLTTLPSTPGPSSGDGVDLLRWPLVGRFLRWRHARFVLQLPLLALAVVLVLHGLFGPELAPKNLATLLTWVHYRGALVLVLLVAGNFFCLACPFLVLRDLARRFVVPPWNWPRRLRNKWPAVVLFVGILFAYEQFALWEAPAATAWLIIGYFLVALVIDLLFRHAAFCKWVCPIGQFNFIASTVSPLEVRVRDVQRCSSCTTRDCIRGTRSQDSGDSASPSGGASRARPLPVVQRGCELALFQPRKVGNLDCTFCLDCIHACPHDNVGIVSRLPAAELFDGSHRSGIGAPGQRKDLAALMVVFTFGALLNAFGMVSPVYTVQAWLGGVLGTSERWPILGILFVAVLVVEPVLLLGLAAWTTRRLARLQQPLLPLATRFACTLVPLGFGVWLAHYAFHFLTGFLTVIPVTQNALRELGWPILGRPDWSLAGLRSEAVFPLELGMLGLGLVGSLLVTARLAREWAPARPLGAFAPWAVLHLALFAAAVWLLSQPMEMRGTFLGG